MRGLLGLGGGMDHSILVNSGLFLCFPLSLTRVSLVTKFS